MSSPDSTSGYMAFGVSGSNTASKMIDGDVAIAGYNNGQAMVEDYFLQAYAFVSFYSLFGYKHLFPII